MVQLLAQWSIVERLLTRDFGKPPNAYLVAAYLGLTKEQRRRVLQAQACRHPDLECLTDRQRTVLTWRYGLNGEESLTYEGIGRRLKLTREWVRQIEQRAIRKLIAQENKCNLLTWAL